MQRNFEIRHKVALAVREYLSSQGFLEIETPFMTRSTPEGARDYLVPSRVHPGEFYALPQSPQIFKQILMISGMDRYFQIARCFRDEDLRADRQPEFTQIDLEMTFPQQETVFAVVEGFLKAAFEITGEQISAPFPRMTYDEAIRRYGIDKPDLRLPAMADLTDELTPELRTALKIEQGLPVLGFTIPRVGELSGTARKALTGDIRASLGDSGLDILDVARLRTSEAFAGLADKITEKLSDELKAFDQSGLVPGDLNVVITPKPGIAAPAKDRLWIYKKVGQLRLDLAKRFQEKHGAFEKKGNADDYKFLWVTDFPFFEWDEQTQTWTFAHHPFHFAARRRPGCRAHGIGSGGGACAGLRYRAQWHGAWFRARFVSIARIFKGRSSARWVCRTRRRSCDSDSSSMRCSTGRLRTEGLRWGWIASS